MSHARIEEVSDSDPEIDDPTSYLPSNDSLIIQRADELLSKPSKSPSRAPQQQQSTPINPTLFRPPVPQPTTANLEDSRAEIKSWVTIYPCYFSSSRTRSQGRRVAKSLAIPNPLAYNILPALKEVCASNPGIQLAFEPDKTHPKDWANPGRVRINFFDADTHKPLVKGITNKEHLFNLVAKWLQEHPTKPEDPLLVRIPGLTVSEKFTEERAQKPRGRGWGVMNEILPMHSAAVSGGGVKDDFFKEAMEEMKQMQAAGGAGGAGAGGMDMGALQQMMQGMGGMGGMGGLGGMLGGGGGSGSGTNSPGGAASKKKDKKK